ncbi:odorant receptor 13a-like [Microplitis mediator]|uniref:odorant receptor 13a-like n=1 Tax=Microplitis mediator TaxID=375433 RepID=UPI002555AF80|nr:odorant receptor 13a-like [Microplitis mediator]
MKTPDHRLSDIAYALGLYKILGRTLGIWPLNCHSISSIIRITFVTVTQLSMSISLIKQLLVKGNCGKITDIVDVLSLIACGVVTVVKVIIPRIYYSKMYVIVSTAINDWKTVNNEKARRTMLRYAYIGRVVFIVQIIGAYAAGFQLIVSRLPFIMKWNNDQNYSSPMYTVPIGPSCWISSDISSFYYTAYYTFQCIQLFVVCTAYIGADTYFFGIAMHVCGQFELLSNSLTNIYSDGKISNQKQNFSKFVERHKHLLLLANNFEDTYNLIILSQVGIDAVLICISGIVLLMTLHTEDLFIIIGLIIRIYLVYVQLFLYSYVGEQLRTQANKIQLTIYNCPWYNMSPKITNDMVFMIMRTNYSFNLTAGKMYFMNMENFKNTIKTMGSFFSVLRLMFIKN